MTNALRAVPDLNGEDLARSWDHRESSVLITIKQNRDLTRNLVTQFSIIRHSCNGLSTMYTANRYQRVFLLKVLVPVGISAPIDI